MSHINMLMLLQMQFQTIHSGYSRFVKLNEQILCDFATGFGE